jgi:hypothetical protein
VKASVPLASVTPAPWAFAYASSRDRSPTPLAPTLGAICSVLRTPKALPSRLMKALPESPGMPGETV